jgi:uncharacterized Fe-S radical SAM superfamily protein PflX
MDQYRPDFHADQHPDIRRPITPEEMSRARSAAEAVGLTRFA